MIKFSISKNLINDLFPVAVAFLVIAISVFTISWLIKKYKWSIKRIDKLDGEKFEDFIKFVLELLGYHVEKTKKTGDQGIDLIVKKHFRKIGVQIKRYSQKVGNSAVQEAVAGKKYYKLDRIWVLTNSTFTRSAIELAKVNGVELIDRTVLKKLMEKARKKEKKFN